MIRRDAQGPGEASARWILISQIDHAGLAGQIARHWGRGDFAPLVPRDELLWAIDHHDDGWREWEAMPEVDEKTGRPRAFTEMPIDDSLRIWSASIDDARGAGPFQGYVVAGHFCALTRRAAAWRNGDPPWPEAETFLQKYAALMDQSLHAWQSENPATNTLQVARQGLAQLQFFDLLSLWFCCAEAHEPEETVAPGGAVLTLTPVDTVRVRLAPWPLTCSSLKLEMPGRAVPVARYKSRSELAAAPSQPVRLCWQLENDSPLTSR